MSERVRRVAAGLLTLSMQSRAGFIVVLTSPFPDCVSTSLPRIVLVCIALSSKRSARLISGEPRGGRPQRGDEPAAAAVGDADASTADDLRLRGLGVSAEMLVPAAIAGEPTAGGVGEGLHSASAADPALPLRARESSAIFSASDCSSLRA